MNLSRHFTLPELTQSKTATDKGIDNQPGEAALLHLRALCTAVLDPLRDSVGQVIKVSSGYRGPALNKLIGAAASQHQEGKAADLQAPGMAALELFKAVIRLALPFDQLIYEPKSATSKWVHVSHNAAANRGQILLASFNAAGKASYAPLTAQQALELREPATRSGRVESADEYVEMHDEPDVPSASKAPAPKAPARLKKPGKAPTTPHGPTQALHRKR
jgi:zinc D-Ala-D-Ala carboxypeptidase